MVSVSFGHVFRLSLQTGLALRSVPSLGQCSREGWDNVGLGFGVRENLAMCFGIRFQSALELGSDQF